VDERKQVLFIDGKTINRRKFGNPSAVLDGDLDGFIEAGIKWRKGRE